MDELTPEEEQRLSELEELDRLRSEIGGSDTSMPSSYQAPTYSEDGVLQINLSDYMSNVDNKLNQIGKGVIDYTSNLPITETVTDYLTEGMDTPEEQQGFLSNLDTANRVAKTTANVAGALAMPISRVAKGASYVPRLANYAVNAIRGATGAGVADVAGDAITQDSDIGEDAVDFTKNAAIGLAIPSAIDTVGTGIRGANNVLNSSFRSAKKYLGASKDQLNRTKGAFVVDDVATLQNEFPETATQVFGKSGDAALQARKATVGRDIGDAYVALSAYPQNDIPVNAIFNLPSLRNLAWQLRNKPFSNQEAQEASEVLAKINERISRIARNGKVLPSDAWELRKMLDQGLKYNRNMNVSEGFGDELTKATSRELQELLDNLGSKHGLDKLNKEYSALSSVESNIAGQAGVEKASKVGQIVEDATGGNLGAVAAKGGILSSNPLYKLVGAARLGVDALNSKSVGRAFMNLSSASRRGEALLQYGPTASIIANSTLLPRDSAALAESPDIFADTVAENIFRKTGDEEVAQVVSQEIREIAVSGNSQAHKDLILSLSMQFPDAFEPAPEGYQSYLDGKLLDPMEQSVHINKALDLDLSPREQADVIGGMLSKKKYSPINTSQSNPVSMNQPMQQQNPLSLFNSSFGSEDAVEVPYSGTEQTGDMLRRLSEALSFKEEYDPMTAQ